MLEKITRWFGGGMFRKADSAGRKILIVDDNATDRQLIKGIVEKAGHTAFLAENGRIGLEIAGSEKPDLILADCIMPVMAGLDMARELKDDPATQNIPLIFLTSVDTPLNVVEGFDAGADNYICKPIKPRLLNAHIDRIFRDRAAA